MGQANDALSGIQHLLRTRRQAPSAWRLLSARGRLEVPCRAPPMPPLVCAGLAGRAIARGEVAFAATIPAAFHRCLRTGEALRLTGAAIQLGPVGRGVTALPRTKTSCQEGARENVTFDDPNVGALVHCQVQRDPSARLRPLSLRAFHRLFRAGL